ncbi:hypothetical protein [Mycobacterium sp. 852013-50091_SCH5140682]|uniref:hypothetical protein n=1 Tax=Mycobacterium sp. 852013-50091_SCH5140682 TaxID=1834109 RepID=UPI001E2FA96A|nr:hypothetical protein [Mycobacterium sp. 852013-50091_SCH5140682]
MSAVPFAGMRHAQRRDGTDERHVAGHGSVGLGQIVVQARRLDCASIAHGRLPSFESVAGRTAVT